MSDDLRQLLHDTATPPTRPVDAAALVGRARRQRRGMQAAGGLAVALVVMVVVVGAQALWPPSTPEVADVPPSQTATIGALASPQQPQDAIPDHIRDQIGLGEQWAATSRLARETPAHDFYVYRDAPRELGASPQACLLIVPHEGDAWAAGCSSDEGRTSRPVVTVNSGEVVAGLVYDGIDNTSQLEGEVVADRPVLNNVFTTGE